STNTVYANFAGEIMLEVFQSGTSTWENYYQYASGGGGNLTLQANPSALTGYNEGLGGRLIDQNAANDSLYLSATTGLIALTDWGSSTTATETMAGDVSGYYKDTQIERGRTAASITLVGSVQYFSHSPGTSSPTVYPVASTTVYRNATTILLDSAA